MAYFPFGLRHPIRDVYDAQNRSDLSEEHRAGAVVRLDEKLDSLVMICLKNLAGTFSRSSELAPSILKAIPHFDRDLFLHVIPTSTPLTISVPTIESEIFWERCCKEKWPQRVYKLKEKNYKQLYAETYLSEFLADVNPGYEDYGEIKELCVLLHKHVFKLRIRRLRVYTKKRGCDQGRCEEEEPGPERLDLRRVTVFLPRLAELSICFGMENAVPVSAVRQAVLLETEIENLGQAIVLSKRLTVLKIHASRFKANDLAIVYHYLISSDIMCLQLEGCALGDSGAQIAALLIKNHAVLIKLGLKDCGIGPEGAYALAYALARSPGSHLKCLDLSMNPVGDEAGSCLATAFASHPSLEEILMCGTRLGSVSGGLLAKAVEINRRLRNVDLSCNHFSRENAVAFLDALEKNRSVHYLDLRSCGLAHETLSDIKDLLFENRDAERMKIVSKPPRRRSRMEQLKDYLAVLPEKTKKEPVVQDPVPVFGSHATSSLTLSDRGQLTLSTVDSTSSESSLLEEPQCSG